MSHGQPAFNTVMDTWEVVARLCQTDGAVGETVYGVQGRAGDAVWEWPDVSPDRRRAEELAHRLRQAQPEYCHLEDIVTDFLHEW